MHSEANAGQNDGERDVGAMQVVGLRSSSQEHALENAVESDHVIDFILSVLAPLGLALHPGRDNSQPLLPLGQRGPVQLLVLDPQQVADDLVRVGECGQRHGLGGARLERDDGGLGLEALRLRIV